MTGIGGNGGVSTHAEWEREQKQRRENHLKKSYPQLNSKQTRSLSVMGARVFLLQGPSLVRRGVLNADLFFKISSCLMGLPVHDVLQVHQAVNARLFYDVDKNIGKGLGIFDSKKKNERKRQAAIERCEDRMKF